MASPREAGRDGGHRPFPRLCPDDRSQLRLRNSALVALPGFRPLSAGALPHWAGAWRRTGRTSRSGPAQFPAGEFAVGILVQALQGHTGVEEPDRKSTRLNSSHGSISYAVFCLKKKKKRKKIT